jgi:hypothetical protein
MLATSRGMQDTAKTLVREHVQRRILILYFVDEVRATGRLSENQPIDRTGKYENSIRHITIGKMTGTTAPTRLPIRILWE